MRTTGPALLAAAKDVSPYMECSVFAQAGELMVSTDVDANRMFETLNDRVLRTL